MDSPRLSRFDRAWNLAVFLLAAPFAFTALPVILAYEHVTEWWSDTRDAWGSARCSARDFWNDSVMGRRTVAERRERELDAMFGARHSQTQESD